MNDLHLSASLSSISISISIFCVFSPTCRGQIASADSFCGRWQCCPCIVTEVYLLFYFVLSSIIKKLQFMSGFEALHVSGFDEYDSYIRVWQ